MSDRDRLERRLRRCERRRLAELNRPQGGLERAAKAVVFAIGIAAGLAVWLWAAERQAQVVEASVLRAHRITDGPLYGPGMITTVEPLPETPPVDGEPPEAMEVPDHYGDTTGMVMTPSDPEPAWESIGEFKLTFYCPCYQCSEGWGYQTSSGNTAQEGWTVAADPRVLKEGTMVMINGHEYRVEDIGGGVRGNHIDIFMESHTECLQNGIQYAEAVVRE